MILFIYHLYMSKMYQSISHVQVANVSQLIREIEERVLIFTAHCHSLQCHFSILYLFFDGLQKRPKEDFALSFAFQSSPIKISEHDGLVILIMTE